MNNAVNAQSVDCITSQNDLMNNSEITIDQLVDADIMNSLDSCLKKDQSLKASTI